MLKAFENFSLLQQIDLLDAIRKGNTVRALTLIERLSSVNFRSIGGIMTPLQTSLLVENHQVTVALLEKGADPNALYPDSPILGTTFSVRIVEGDLSTIKLLLLHGAKILPKDLEFASLAIRDLIISITPQYQEIKKLENSLKMKDDRNAQIYRRLQALWLDLAQDEPNLIYKGYYQQRASGALARYIELDTEAFIQIRKLKT